jgi:hypothetical protein
MLGECTQAEADISAILDELRRQAAAEAAAAAIAISGAYTRADSEDATWPQQTRPAAGDRGVSWPAAAADGRGADEGLTDPRAGRPGMAAAGAGARGDRGAAQDTVPGANAFLMRLAVAQVPGVAR